MTQAELSLAVRTIRLESLNSENSTSQRIRNWNKRRAPPHQMVFGGGALRLLRRYERGTECNRLNQSPEPIIGEN